MSAFTSPEPYAPPEADLDGFGAGVLRLERDPRVEPLEIAGRAGRLFMAHLGEARTRRGRLNRDEVNAALIGLVVRSPNGSLARIAGVESHCTMTLGAGEALGLLLVPVEES